MRKEMQLSIEEYVDASVRCEDSETVTLLESMRGYIEAEVRVKNLNITSSGELKPTKKTYLREWDVDDEKIMILLERM